MALARAARARLLALPPPLAVRLVAALAGVGLPLAAGVAGAPRLRRRVTLLVEKLAGGRVHTGGSDGGGEDMAAAPLPVTSVVQLLTTLRRLRLPLRRSIAQRLGLEVVAPCLTRLAAEAEAASGESPRGASMRPSGAQQGTQTPHPDAAAAVDNAAAAGVLVASLAAGLRGAGFACRPRRVLVTPAATAVTPTPGTAPAPEEAPAPGGGGGAAAAASAASLAAPPHQPHLRQGGAGARAVRLRALRASRAQQATRRAGQGRAERVVKRALWDAGRAALVAPLELGVGLMPRGVMPVAQAVGKGHERLAAVEAAAAAGGGAKDPLPISAQVVPASCLCAYLTGACVVGEG